MDEPIQPYADGLLLGVASADHQCEGYEARWHDIRDTWEQAQAQVPRGRATDFWERYPEDIALAAALGCNAFRLSLAWARLEPAPGVYDDAAFAHYRDLLERMRSAGIEPIVTLLHNTWPVHVEERGGLIGDAFPVLFAAYAREVAHRLGDLITYYVSLNEPTQLPYGYFKPWWWRAYAMPPGMPRGAPSQDQLQTVAVCMRNLFLAHTAARRAIAQVTPRARVGTNPLSLGFPLWLQRFMDWRVTQVRDLDHFVARERPLTQRRLLARGNVDLLLAQLTVTPHREAEVAFTEAYFETASALLVPRDSPLHAAADLGKGNLIVVAGTTAQEAAPSLFPGAVLIVLNDLNEARVALSSGLADALLSDDAVLAGLAAATPGQFRLLDDRFGQAFYAAALAQGNRALFNVVDQEMRAFKESGAWAQSFARNFPARAVSAPPTFGRRADLAHVSGRGEPDPPPASGTPGLAPHGTLLRKIQRRGELIVGISPHVPGLCGEAQPGSYTGLEVDLARAIAQRLFGNPDRVRFVEVGAAQRIRNIRNPFQRALDRVERALAIISTQMNSNWWHLGMAGKLPAFICPPECVGQQDYVGFDYYWGIPSLNLHRVSRLMDAARQQYALAPVWPSLLYDILRYHAELFPGAEILIIENGCVDAADGYTRDKYLDAHIREVERAIADGVPVRGYLAWSLTSNREWGLPFNANSDFGIYHIDLDTDSGLVRKPTKAAASYAAAIARLRAKYPRVTPA